MKPLGPPSPSLSKSTTMTRGQAGMLGAVGSGSSRNFGMLPAEPSAASMASKMGAALGAQEEQQAEEDNPFIVPPDEEIFRLQEQQLHQRTIRKAQLASMSVQDKSTFASQMQSTLNGDLAKSLAKELHSSMRLGAGPDREREAAVNPHLLPGAHEEQRQKSAAEQAMGSCAPRWREHENMADFIAKKREIFLVRMSLETKRAEIKKLQDRADQREQALLKSEQMLEDDTKRFDEFLKQNDAMVQEAIKRADTESKAKNDKVAEIKRLTAVIASLRSDMSRTEELLEECRRYATFLDGITPQEWFEQHAAHIKAKKEAKLGEWRQACEAVRRRKEAAQEAKQRAEQEYATARSQQAMERAERQVIEAVAALREAMREVEPPKPDVEDPAVVPVEEPPMYFRKPAQLLQVFSQLEEDNLFLIQNQQEADEELEELQAKRRDTQADMEAEVEALRAQISALQLQIEAARGRAERLRERAGHGLGGEHSSLGSEAGKTLKGGASTSGSGSTAGAASGSGPATLEQLAAKVSEAYVRCGFDADASMGPLLMLANMETRVEAYLAVVEGLPQEYVEAAEKAREKARRQVIRQEKLQAQQVEHEARVKRALERAAAPVFKKAGKPVMFRSRLFKKESVSSEQQQQQDDDDELEAFLARDML